MNVLMLYFVPDQLPDSRKMDQFVEPYQTEARKQIFDKDPDLSRDTNIMFHTSVFVDNVFEEITCKNITEFVQASRLDPFSYCFVFSNLDVVNLPIRFSWLSPFLINPVITKRLSPATQKVILIHVERTVYKTAIDIMEAKRNGEQYASNKIASSLAGQQSKDEKDPVVIVDRPPTYFHHIFIDTGMTWSQIKELIDTEINSVDWDLLFINYGHGLDKSPIFSNQIKKLFNDQIIVQ